MRIVLLLTLLSSLACAQYPLGANALRWEGTTSSAGPFCWGFSCTPERAAIAPGERGSFLVRGEFRQPYVLALSAGLGRCRSIPGALNQLVLADPFVVFAAGSLDRTSPILACPPGTARVPIQVPASLPRGTTFFVQGAVGLPRSTGTRAAVSLTQTIAFTVR